MIYIRKIEKLKKTKGKQILRFKKKKKKKKSDLKFLGRLLLRALCVPVRHANMCDGALFVSTVDGTNVSLFYSM